jgi:hypothetical protein
VCETDVLVSLRGVVKKAVFDRALGDLDSDAIGAHVLHLGDDAEFLQRHASGHDGVLAVDSMAGLGLDHDVFVVSDQRYRQAFLGDFQHARVGVTAEVGLFLQPVENANPVKNNPRLANSSRHRTRLSCGLTDTL